ncbi:hypothetical protein GCM10010844_33030 [Deinococcus radiotolerans]|uniref:Uncharacterized protein n=2 Tax=Deinococcus radiotolerans TaxID=1309407 RepID=A0ABQ2FNM7_9DEIO|nr:hypothetical protein GCM10010844_33030 [Deinococcus radiotolerans]
MGVGVAAAALLTGGVVGAQGLPAGQTFVVSCPGGTSQGCTTYAVEKGLLICYCGTERVLLRARPETLAQLRAAGTPQVVNLRGSAGSRTLYVFSSDPKLRGALAGAFQAEWVQGAAPALNIAFQRR